MKQLIMTALILAMGAAICTPATAKKKDKKTAVATTAAAPSQPVTLSTPADSLSYAAGAAMTNGLMPFLKQQYGVEEADMPHFVEGFSEALRQPDTPEQKARDAGRQVARMVTDRMLPSAHADFGGSGIDIDDATFYRGFTDALQHDTTHFSQTEAETYFRNHRETAKKAQAEAVKAEGRRFLEANAKKDGVKTTASGLQYRVLKAGTGAIPEKGDEVKVDYEGRLINGTVFDSSYERGEPATFRTTGVIKGWTEALSMMPVGSKWELYIPQELAYGERGAGKDIRPYETLIFTVELLDITKKKTAPKPTPKAAISKTKPAAKPAAKTAGKTAK